jgi:hypothetical protein
VCILTLSRYPDLFVGLQGTIDEFAPGFDRVLVKDGYLITEDKSWLVAQGPSGPFCYARNVNLGLSLVDKDADVLLMGDDVRFKDENTIEKLFALAYSDRTIGILSPRIIGGADNPMLTDPSQTEDLSYTERYVPLVCAYIKRRALMNGLDAETFNKGFGWDDVDFSRRVYLSQFNLAVTPRVEVIHGVSRKGSETVVRNEKGDHVAIKDLDEIGAQAYEAKWGDRLKEGWSRPWDWQ